jgi:glycosyltransferase involved in cell wall biosynthesis
MDEAMNIIVTGGFEANYIVGFCKGLAANGVELCVVSCDETASRLTAAGIRNVNLRGSVIEGRPAWRKLANLGSYYARLILMLFRNRGATVHFIGIFRDALILWEGIFLNLCFRLAAGRYLYTVHNVLPHNMRENGFQRWIYRRIYAIPDVVLVHTRLAREQLMHEFGVPEHKIQLTSVGLNEEIPECGVTVSEARGRIGLGGSEQGILFFGKLDEYKGLDLLLAAFDALPIPEARLIIAGTFRNSAYRTRILAQLDGMRRRAEVRLDERFVPNEEVGIYFNACDVLCLPYRDICQSGLLFLGPRFGIPIVATDVGSFREFMEEKLGLVTRTNDAPGIADALGQVLRAPDLFSSAAILDHARKYRWVNVCRPLVPLYSAGSHGLPGHYEDDRAPGGSGVGPVGKSTPIYSSEHR